ncbi:hypothetical protein L3Q82_002781 [Scortum barcoo]|uniref:Uncharacterized protein n=1 Tax=Scortum barcoo TaxID=214431 RepID=A0ACB8VVN9_9TELE|nr:hypothetical protein L3Q82_002781 [Scortum barcoo]
MNRTGDKGQAWQSPTPTGNIGIFSECPSQSASGHMVVGILQIYKTHVDWLGKLPCPFQHPAKGKELVHCSMTRTKTTLFLLNPRFDYWSDSSLQYPGVDLPMEAEECDPPIVGTHLWSPSS